MSSYSQSMKTFLSAPRYAVVGASNDRTKWSNKVLRWYQARDLEVIPVHPKDTEIEGLQVVKDVMNLPSLSETSISMLVNPSIGLPILERLFASPDPSDWPRALWFQPGSEDERIRTFFDKIGRGVGDRVVLGGACVLVLGDGIRQELNVADGDQDAGGRAGRGSHL